MSNIFNKLIDNHNNSLPRLIEHLKTPRTVVGCFDVLYKRKIGSGEYSLALAEAVAAALRTGVHGDHGRARHRVSDCVRVSRRPRTLDQGDGPVGRRHRARVHAVWSGAARQAQCVARRPPAKGCSRCSRCARNSGMELVWL